MILSTLVTGIKWLGFMIAAGSATVGVEYLDETLKERGYISPDSRLTLLPEVKNDQPLEEQHLKIKGKLVYESYVEKPMQASVTITPAFANRHNIYSIEYIKNSLHAVALESLNSIDNLNESSLENRRRCLRPLTKKRLEYFAEYGTIHSHEEQQMVDKHINQLFESVQDYYEQRFYTKNLTPNTHRQD